jgi:hypothetical protein
MAVKKKKSTTKIVRKKTTSRKPGAKAGASNRVAQEGARLDRLTVDLICEAAKDVHSEILKQNKPDLTFPVRSLKNVSYSTKRGYFEIGKQKKTRTLTVNTVKSFAQTLRMMGLSKDLVEGNDFATKRDAYYQSKNWNEAKFDEQTESDTVMDDIEALFSLRGRAAHRSRPRSRNRRGRTHRLHTFWVRRLFDPVECRTSLFRDRREIHPRNRNRGCVSTPAEPQVLAVIELHSGFDGGCPDPSHAQIHPEALG